MDKLTIKKIIGTNVEITIEFMISTLNILDLFSNLINFLHLSNIPKINNIEPIKEYINVIKLYH